MASSCRYTEHEDRFAGNISAGPRLGERDGGNSGSGASYDPSHGHRVV